tara:strand:+ start:184 stop:351 length:168 start_codon:yes stop_codon:yes gene_type:complete
MQLLLYSYCQAFNTDPNTAKDTPMSLIMDMMIIHGEVEKMKSDEVENMRRKQRNG